MREIARRLEATGQLDYINTSIGEFHNLYMVEGSMHTPPGYQLFVSASIREAVKLPVFCTGRIKDPVQAERILREGLADMVDVVRGQICDPAFTRKAREGRTEAIRLCISCNQYCIGRMGLNLSLGCIQTPATGNELLFPTLKPPRPQPRKPGLIVAGGGPAGMQAAKVAAQRGYSVRLYERQQELGGQINLITRVPGRVEFGDASRNLQRDIIEAGVKVHTGIEVTAEMIEREQPDAVIIATGSLPALPPIPGAELALCRHYLAGVTGREKRAAGRIRAAV